MATERAAKQGLGHAHSATVGFLAVHKRCERLSQLALRTVLVRLLLVFPHYLGACHARAERSSSPPNTHLGDVIERDEGKQSQKALHIDIWGTIEVLVEGVA